MKALITAGGRATRLRPITYTINKHLIPIANKPMISYALEKIAAAGIKDVAININEGDAELKKYLGYGQKWNLRLTYLEQKGGALGLAHIIKNAAEWIGEDDLLFYLGDNIVMADLKPFIDVFYERNLNALLLLAKVKDPQRFGVPVIENGRLVRIEEKPANPQSPYAVTGLYFYDKNIMEAVVSLKPSSRGELEISDANSFLIEKGLRVGLKEISGWWKDTGKPEDLLEGNSLILDKFCQGRILGNVSPQGIIQGEVAIGSGTKIEGKTIIRGPAIIGENCLIADSYIGPYTSLGNEVQVIGSEVENSIVFDKAVINCGKKIVDSLIGMNALILAERDSIPSGHKMLIGDHGVVEI